MVASKKEEKVNVVQEKYGEDEKEEWKPKEKNKKNKKVLQTKI